MAAQKPDSLFEMETPATVRRGKDGRRHPKSRYAQIDLRGLEVTEDDIAGAMRENSHSCMIADAMKRQLPDARNVAVDLQTIRWTDTAKNRRIVCLTPMPCQAALLAFDYGAVPAPFKFNLKAAQITDKTVTEPVRDGSGKPVKTAAGRHLHRKVSQPKVSEARLEGHFDHGDALKIGGRVPPMERASRFRKFGVKGFTWDKGEDPAEIARRQNLANGRPADYSPFAEK